MTRTAAVAAMAAATVLLLSGCSDEATPEPSGEVGDLSVNMDAVYYWDDFTGEGWERTESGYESATLNCTVNPATFTGGSVEDSSDAAETVVQRESLQQEFGDESEVGTTRVNIADEDLQMEFETLTYPSPDREDGTGMVAYRYAADGGVLYMTIVNCGPETEASELMSEVLDSGQLQLTLAL